MVNLLDIVRQAQSGAAVGNLSRQFGLRLDQTQRAVEALLPAFSLAFQRSLRNPGAFGQLLELMSSGRYAPFFDGMTFPSTARSDGQEILDRIFGSDEVSRQVAAQASALTGVGTRIMHEMLPPLAAVLVGGLFRFSSLEGLSDFLQAWADWLRSISPAQAAPRPEPSHPGATVFGAWSDLMGAMLGQPAVPSRPAPSPAAADPWTAYLQAMTMAVPRPETPPPAPPPAQPNPLEVLTQMFETGRDVQSQYLANLQRVMDGFWRPPGESKAGQA